MKPSSTYILIAAILMMAILMYWVSEGRSSRPPAPTFMLPHLKANLANVSRVSLESGEVSVTLEQTDGQWRVKERFQFAADFKKLSTFINNLANAKLWEKKTKNPENFPRLGVAETSAVATLVTVFAGEDRYTFVSGALASSGSKSQRKGRFVRITDEQADSNQVWLTDIGWVISADPVSWLDKNLLDVSAEKITRVTIQQSDETLAVSRRDGSWQIENLPEGAELAYPSIASNLSRALVRLRCNDVRLASDINFNQAVVVTFELEPDRANGRNIILLNVIELDGDFWLKIIESDGPEKNKNWAYKIDQLAYSGLTKKLSDLLRQGT